MDLKTALLADMVNETKEGKLNIIGVFDLVHGRRVPMTHDQMTMVALLEGSVSEGTEHKMQVGLFDADGAEVLPLSPPLPLRFVPSGKGKPFKARAVFQLSGIRFPHFGDFEFHLLVDGRLMGTVPLEVRQVKEGKGRGPR